MIKNSWELRVRGIYIIIIGNMNYFANVVSAIVDCDNAFSIVCKILYFFIFNITAIQNLLNSIVFIVLIYYVHFF